MQSKVLSIVFLGLIGFASITYAADIEAGKKKAKSCAGCHGQNGISNNNLWPNLAGQKKDYMVKQLKDFKSGVRKDAQMSYWAKSLSESDMENIAEYFSKLK